METSVTALPGIHSALALWRPCFDDEQNLHSYYAADVKNEHENMFTKRLKGDLSSSLKIAAAGNSWLLNEVAGLGKEIHYQGFWKKKSTKPFGTNNQRKIEAMQ
jgi:hypothetical protein